MNGPRYAHSNYGGNKGGPSNSTSGVFAGDIRCQVSNKSIMLISLKITNSPNSNSRGSSSSSSTSKSSSKTSFTQ
uniref:Putative uncharacterized transmembrane protein DDB_G0290657 n=1 Tax=Dictyostelium discoideum TaxID=44689 RepID=Y9576_DICDI|nr:RecName: Full=Putative uncharacterized transmembrane protein DDB_G0290657 [Dictyostelium discoideum]